MPKVLPLLIIGGLISSISAPSRAEAFKALEYYAEHVTLPIETPNNGGSVTIIGKRGNTYTFLTAAHVIAATAKGEEDSVDLSSQAGKDLFAKATIKKDFRSDGIDLAVGTFQYSGKSNLEVLPLFGLAPDAKWEDDPSQYKKVSLPCDDKSLEIECIKIPNVGDSANCYFTGTGTAPCNKPPTVTVTKRLSNGSYERFNGVYNGKTYYTKTGTIGNFVIAGYSLPSRAITARVMRVSFAAPQNLLAKNKDGYNLIYEATSTVPGMSGGPVIAARLCPMLNEFRGFGAYAGIIGIHGKSEEYNYTSSRSGISLAIPIIHPVVVNYLISNSKVLGIPTENTYMQKVESTCSKRNAFFH